MYSISVLHVISGLQPSFGGPSRTVTQLTDALAAIPELRISLLTQSPTGVSVVKTLNPAVNQRVMESNSPLSLRFGKPVQRGLVSWLNSVQPDLLHGHGLWHPVNHWTAHAARVRNIPLILHPRGMLEPWALAHSGVKKRLAMALYQRKDIDTARVLVATAEQEYENLRSLGLKQPIAIIPNGVPLSPVGVGNKPKIRSPEMERTVLFLSRIHGKKGLLNLIDAWAQVRPHGWRLRIAGPNEDGHLAEVLERALRMGISDFIDYIGVVDGEAKSTLYLDSDLFVLPTFSENFGLVVAEALAHGVPVITTQGAPWADLRRYHCGWWIPIGVEPLAAALNEAIALSDAERTEMGERGLAYVQRYDWGSIARDMAEVYRWVLGQGSMPDCLQIK